MGCKIFEVENLHKGKYNPRIPGEITYRCLQESEVWSVPNERGSMRALKAREIIGAIEDGDEAVKAMDEAVKEQDTEAIKKLLPFAYAQFMRAALEARPHIAASWRDAIPLVLREKDGYTIKINPNSKILAKKWGLTR